MKLEHINVNFKRKYLLVQQIISLRHITDREVYHHKSFPFEKFIKKYLMLYKNNNVYFFFP